jgi:Zn-dependent peptidase ImmA (M78 family)
MDIFHELGHLILHRDLDERYTSVPMFHKLIEDQAFTFAGAFALPAGPFADDIYSLSLDSFVRLKEKWRIAISAMVMRCGSLGIASESQLEKLWKSMAVKGWRKEEPLDDEMAIEKPYMLSRAIEIMIEDRIVHKESIASSLALPESDIEDITSLERGFLGTPDPKLYSMPPPLFADDPAMLKTPKISGRVISFKKQPKAN